MGAVAEELPVAFAVAYLVAAVVVAAVVVAIVVVVVVVVAAAEEKHQPFLKLVFAALAFVAVDPPVLKLM